VPPPPQTTAAQLGAAIRLLRKGSREMTIEALASEADIHWTYLSQIENGKRNPTWEVLCNLATALDVTILELVRLADEQVVGEG
jgi:transcriptional regulator with XRE-family HTH domain